MLDRDVFVREPLGVVLGADEQLVQRLRHVDLAHLRVAGDVRARRELLLDAGLDVRDGGAGLLDDLRHEAVFLEKQGEEQMLDIHLLVSEADRNFPRGLDGLLGFLCQFVNIHSWKSPLP